VGCARVSHISVGELEIRFVIWNEVKVSAALLRDIAERLPENHYRQDSEKAHADGEESHDYGLFELHVRRK